MRVPTLTMIRAARQEGFAVAAVNVVDDLSLRAAVGAAVRADAPLIVQMSVRTVRAFGVPRATQMFDAATAGIDVPVALHLDHCPDPALIAEVARAGWSSALYDASMLDLADAEASTRDVVIDAHAHQLAVESEIENIIGVEDGVGSDTVRHQYPDDVLADVARRTGADLIAPQLGTAHGRYRRAPVLLPQRVRALARLTTTPVVLHGGTGLAEADVRAFIEAGVAKINVSTALKVAYLQAARGYLAQQPAGGGEPSEMFAAVDEAVQRVISRHLVTFGSVGRASVVSP